MAPKLTLEDLDPVFPIQAGTGIDRNLKPGQGAEILANDSINAETGLTYRAFWHIWENVEVTAARMYPRYVTNNKDVAATWLEAVVWCRNVAHRAANFGIGEVAVYSEDEAQKVREAVNPKKRASRVAPKPSESPSKEIEGGPVTKEPKKKKDKQEKDKKKGKKGKKKGSSK